MRSMRHPNPLIDVRRPRHKEEVGVNPPGFVWHPIEGVREYRLEVSRSRRFDDPTTETHTVSGRTLLLLPRCLESGRWYWRWGAGQKWSQVFSFEMLEDAATVEVPIDREDLAARFGGHPRLMVPPGSLDGLRERWKNEEADLLAEVTARADAHLAQPHEMDEPPFLPQRSEDYNRTHVIWRKAMVDSRQFCAGAQDLAFAYLLGGDRRYAEAAARRLDSISRWDPDGSTAIAHNDEPHMAVINWMPFTFDWVFDAVDDARRGRIVAHLAKRADNTLKHLLHWPYEVHPVSNHAGRMIGFLGNCGLALAGHHERAGEWLKYVLELMVTMYPAWGAEAGGWAQGFSYGGAYVRWILEFLFSLKTALGIDLYRKPFFRNHGRWYALCLPEVAWQNPFGDGGEQDFSKVNAAVITRHLALMTGDVAVARYAERLGKRVEGEKGVRPLLPVGPQGASHKRGLTPFSTRPRQTPVSAGPLLVLAEDAAAEAGRGEACLTPPGPRSARLPKAACFPDVGYVAMRRDIENPDDDISLVLKSSPYGPVSHSHGDQNAFVLSAFGQPLLIRTGCYTGYGNPHHQNWVRQTKAHNAVTVGGVGQWVDNFAAVGRTPAFKSRRHFAYAVGDASVAYGDRLTRFHRHVLFVDHRYFFILDDLASPVDTTFEFHLHGIEKMTTEEGSKRVRVAHGGAQVDVHFLCEFEMRFYQTDVFDPPNDDPAAAGPANRWHLRAATVPVSRTLTSGMLLIPNRQDRPETFEVTTCSGDTFFGTRVTHGRHTDEFLIAKTEDSMEYRGERIAGRAVWVRDGEVKLRVSRPRARR